MVGVMSLPEDRAGKEGQVDEGERGARHMEGDRHGFRVLESPQDKLVKYC